MEPEARAKRLLFISHWFPPYSAIGALRVGKLAKYLDDRSWDVRVVAAQLPIPKAMPLEIDEDKVVYTPWLEVDATLERWLGDRFTRLVHQSPAAASRGANATIPNEPARSSALRTALRNLYLELVRLPDNRAGWRKPAMQAANTLIGNWRPDVIYASAPPVTSVLIASALSKQHGIPWVAEFRDMWTDHPYYEYSAVRLMFERKWEERVLASAAAVVTVSSPWQRRLISRFGRPTVLAMNGYVASDFPVQPPLEPARGGPVRILYTGHIYMGRRDPSPLFAAMKLLGPDLQHIQVEFIGTQVDLVNAIAKRFDLEDRVVVAEPVPYQEALQRQLEADVLLHLQWCDPKEEGTIAGKLFEYIGARRPVLGIGLEDSAAAELVRSRDAGTFTNDPQKIAEQLRTWIKQKSAGGIPPLPASATVGLERDGQFEKIEKLLSGVIGVPTAKADRQTVKRRHRDPTGFSVTRGFRPATTGMLDRPTLVATVDVEEEFDWRKPFSRDNTSVRALEQLPRAHAIFLKHNIRPTYLVDYPVINSAFGAELFREWCKRGECVVGAQLHPWVTPPFEEEVKVVNTYPGNLSPQLERAKLKVLTEKIEENCGVRPVVYRAGRYGLGPNSIQALEELGYQVDTSIVPYTDMRRELGPDYSDYAADPFWFGSNGQLLELPLTRKFVGPLRPVGSTAYKWLTGGIGGMLRAGGIAARLQMLQRVTLTPEGITLQELKRLTKEARADGQTIFVISFHSPSLLPGSTPYVRTESEAVSFLETIDLYLDHFLGKLGGQSLTPLQVYRALSSGAGQLS